MKCEFDFVRIGCIIKQMEVLIMRFQDIKRTYNEKTDEVTYGLTGDINMETYLSEYIDDEYSFTLIKVKEIANITIEIPMKNIINMLIDDMYEDEPAIMTDELAEEFLENGDDVIMKAIETQTEWFINDTLKDMVDDWIEHAKNKKVIWK